MAHDYRFTASVTVYSLDDEFSARKTVCGSVEADSLLDAQDSVGEVIRDITGMWGCEDVDWQVQRTEIHRVDWEGFVNVDSPRRVK